MPRSSYFRATLKVLVRLLLFAAIAFGLLIAALCLDHNRDTTLLTPTGPFAVARTTHVWDDRTSVDPTAPQPGAHRKLVAWIWYPATPLPAQQSPPLAEYLPASWRTALNTRRGSILSYLLTRDLSRVHAHSIRDAQLAPQQPSYPVVFLRAGLAALTTDYTSLAEDLASHGYVVVGFDAPYRTWIVVLPDGTVIPRAPQNNAELLSGLEQEQLAIKLVRAWTADTTFALNQLERLNQSDPSGTFRGRLGLHRIGIFGHSLGGVTSLQFCHEDARCQAGIDIDGAPIGSVIAAGVSKPFMFLLSAQIESSAAESNKVRASIQSIYDRLPPQGRLDLEILGANHYLFSDDGAFLKTRVIATPLRLLGLLRIDGRRQLALTAFCVRSFFDTYLKRANTPPLKLASPQYPELHELRQAFETLPSHQNSILE